jgi:hypothetical protein
LLQQYPPSIPCPSYGKGWVLLHEVAVAMASDSRMSTHAITGWERWSCRRFREGAAGCASTSKARPMVKEMVKVAKMATVSPAVVAVIVPDAAALVLPSVLSLQVVPVLVHEPVVVTSTTSWRAGLAMLRVGLALSPAAKVTRMEAGRMVLSVLLHSVAFSAPCALVSPPLPPRAGAK